MVRGRRIKSRQTHKGFTMPSTLSTGRINCPSLMSDRGMGSHPSHSEADPTIVGSPVATPRSIQRRRLRPHAPFSVAHVSLKFSGTSVRQKALPHTLTGRDKPTEDPLLKTRPLSLLTRCC